MPDDSLIWGPGSSSISITRTEHGRIRLGLSNDFDGAIGIFDDQGARDMIKALTDLLEDNPK